MVFWGRCEKNRGKKLKGSSLRMKEKGKRGCVWMYGGVGEGRVESCKTSPISKGQNEKARAMRPKMNLA